MRDQQYKLSRRCLSESKIFVRKHGAGPQEAAADMECDFAFRHICGTVYVSQVCLFYCKNMDGTDGRSWDIHIYEKKEYRRKIALQRVVKEPSVFSRKMLCHKKNLIIYLKGGPVYGTHRKQNNYT